MGKLKVSIIIVTWNNENEIENCINSIYCQTKKYSFEIIVVDNESKDDTVAILKKQYPTVQVILSGGNLGFSKANNLGINMAKGELLLFLNPDTIILSGAIDKSVDYLCQYENYGIVSCRLLNQDFSLQPSTFRFLRADLILLEQFNLQKYFPNSIGKYYGFFGNYNRKVDWCIGAFLLARKNDIMKIKGFTENYFMYLEDMDICYKVKKVLNKDIIYIYDAMCIHLGGASEKQSYNNARSLRIFDSLVVFLNIYLAKDVNFYLDIYIFCYQIKKIIFSFNNLFWKSEKMKLMIDKYKKNIIYLKNKKM